MSPLSQDVDLINHTIPSPIFSFKIELTQVLLFVGNREEFFISRAKKNFFWQSGYKISQTDQNGRSLWPSLTSFPPLHSTTSTSFSFTIPSAAASLFLILYNMAKKQSKSMIVKQVCMKLFASWWWRERNFTEIVKKFNVMLQS